MSSSFLILTSGDLPEAYFLGAFLESVSQPFALVNILGRPVSNQLRVLARLRRNRGVRCVADILLARLANRLDGSFRGERSPRTMPAFPEITAPLVREIRSRHPCLDCRDPHAEAVLDFVRRAAPDYILLAGAPILKPSFYGLARRVALNRHLGLLPDCRGSDCAVWAFALDRPETVGYSIHLVSERVDGGDLILRRPLPVRGEPTLHHYLRRLRREASEAFVDVIGQLLRGVALRAAPQGGTGTYFPPAGWTIQRRALRKYRHLMSRLAAGTANDMPPPAPPAASRVS
ncbi:MAG TPA: formyltransferase family protein [Methylomirabilota bacterium]|nr:formyltransferase family protein [Methylomirabilota bacterium]